jgi:hypothetical protein
MSLGFRGSVAELEKYKSKTTRIKYVLMSFAIVGIFCMLIQKPIIKNETIFYSDKLSLSFFHRFIILLNFQYRNDLGY